MKRQSIRPTDQHEEGEDDGEKQVEEEDVTWAPVRANSTVLEGKVVSSLESL